ncbi:MAG: RDD family protein [Acidobacteriota bacterium]
MTRFCPYCGNQISLRSKFCPKCGKNLPTPRHGVAVQEPDAAVAKPIPELVEKMNRAASAPPATLNVPSYVDAQADAAKAPPLAAAEHRIAPPTHAFIGLHKQAGFGLRYGAWMFDFLLTLIVIMGSTFLISAVGRRSIVDSNRDLFIVAGVTFLLLFLNFIVMAGRSGQSIGMRIIGIQIIYNNGRPFTIKGALIRHLIGYPLSMLAGFLGFLWMLWDPRQQGWHDKLAKTIVVMSR